MSLLPRVSYPGRQAWIGLLFSGMLFWVWAVLIVLMILVCFLLFPNVIITLAYPGLGSRVHGDDFFDWIPSEAWLVAWVCGVAFLAALLAGRSRWIYRPALSAFLACAVALMVWVSPALAVALGLKDPHMLGRGDIGFLSLLWLPLLAAPFGGWLSARWFGAEK